MISNTDGSSDTSTVLSKRSSSRVTTLGESISLDETLCLTKVSITLLGKALFPRFVQGFSEIELV